MADLRGRIDRIADRLTPPDRTSDPVRYIIEGLEAGDLCAGVMRYADATGQTPEEVARSLEYIVSLVAAEDVDGGDRP